MSDPKFTAEECEEIIPMAVEMISKAWDMLADALSCAFLNNYWRRDSSWKAYCDRTMGVGRDYPKAVRDLLIVAMSEAGITGRPIAEASGASQPTVSRVAAAGAAGPSFYMGADGKRYGPLEKPDVTPEKAARIATSEWIRELYKVSDKLSRWEPETITEAEMVEGELRRMIKNMTSRLAWIERNRGALREGGPDDF